jgi:AcrR family transcriptional regulator
VPRIALQADEIAAMRALATELGVSAMTSYRYLAGKDELFAMVRAEAFRRFGDRLEAASRKGSADPEARLRRLKRAYIQFAIDDADAYRIMFELRSPDDAAASASAADADIERASRRAFGFLHDAVRAAVTAGALHGDPLTVAHLLWASTHGLVSLHLAGRLSARTLEQLSKIDHEMAGFRR